MSRRWIWVTLRPDGRTICPSKGRPLAGANLTGEMEAVLDRSNRSPAGPRALLVADPSERRRHSPFGCVEGVIRLISRWYSVVAAERFTSVPVKASTLRALQAYRVGGKSYDEVIRDFIESTPPSTFWKEIERRAKEPELTLEQVRAKLDL